jgi:hypothetical protein
MYFELPRVKHAERNRCNPIALGPGLGVPDPKNKFVLRPIRRDRIPNPFDVRREINHEF